MAASTPLLLLLDGMLSQETNQIQNAISQILKLIQNSKEAGVVEHASLGSICSPLSANLPELIRVLLQACPLLASTPNDSDGSLPLHFTAALGNIEVARLLVAQCSKSVSTPNLKGKIPLHYAAREGRTAMVSFLLHHDKHCAKIPSSKKKLALHFAAGEGHLPVVRELLKAHPEGASSQSSKGKLPLHLAARWGHLEIVRDLLSLYPAGVRTQDWEGSLPLHDAARGGQRQMAELLIDCYTKGLSTTNIRGDIPLFPAVQSANIELVVSLLKSWPAGGKFILKTASALDNVDDWSFEILELCLRCAVGNLQCSILLDGKNPSDASLDGNFSGTERCVESQVTHPMSGIADMCQYSIPPSREELFANCVSVGHAMRNSHCSEDNTAQAMNFYPRKSFVDMKGRKKRSSALSSKLVKKKLRVLGLKENHPSTGNMSLGGSPEFFALHAALECETSSHVIKCILKARPQQVKQPDSFGRLPLHIAVAKKTEENIVELILEDILKPFPEAVRVRDSLNRLPLHVALSSGADFRLVEALVKVDPSLAYQPCLTKDVRFENKMPLFMAAEYGCDLSTTFMLLRGDPSVLHDSTASSV